MRNINAVLAELADTTKKTEKEAILVANKDNLLLKEVFRLAYSPTVQFFVKKVPEYRREPTSTTTNNDVLLVLDKLYNRFVTGNAAHALLVETLSNVTSEVADVITRIVKKDLRCGVGHSTINKVWEGLIVKPPRQGAQSMNEKSLAKISKAKRLAIELKSDGSYAASVCGEAPTMMSRNGNPLEGLDKLLSELSHEAFHGFALEGELVYDLTKATREEGNGIVTKIVKGTASEEECNNVYYQVWDCVDTEYYESKGEYPLSNDARRQLLEVMIEESGCECIKLIPRTPNVTMDEANKIFEEYVKAGFEGAILKDMDATWKDNGKPSWCVKMKRKDTADLEVVGIFEGEGKAAGMLGGVYLETDCGEIKCKAGSGFTDEQRQYYWVNENEIVGKVVEIEYDSITTDKKTKQHSLFLPIFKGVRVDKGLADTMVDVKAKQRF